jgi:hypothetical protein
MDMMKQIYGHTLPRTTAYSTINNEIKLYDDERADKVPFSESKAFHRKIDIVNYVAEYEQAKNNLKNHDVEPQQFGRMGRPYRYHPILYPRLMARLEEVKDVVGFGPMLVASIVGDILKPLLENAADDVSVFEPSVEWCRWFLRTKMSLVKRRVTSHAYTAQEREKQAHLHQLNLDHLSVMISEGLTANFIFCTDELGVNLQPEEVERWVKKGTKVVSFSLSADKRSFTANIIANAAGEVIAHHQIFGGKTEACLPAESVRVSFKKDGYIFSYSDNHWNNQRLKLLELTTIHSWKVQKFLRSVTNFILPIFY